MGGGINWSSLIRALKVSLSLLWLGKVACLRPAMSVRGRVFIFLPAELVAAAH
jgi:hypothetical protein